ncbi:unnamed protein product [Sympodiomycopsis kandeliae]
MAARTMTISMTYAATAAISKDVYWYLPWKPANIKRARNMSVSPSESPSQARKPSEAAEPHTEGTTLPLELLLQIAEDFLRLHSNGGVMLSPEYHGSNPGQSRGHEAESILFATILNLSSTNAAMRRLLAPLIWREIIICRPDKLGKLRSLMDYYQRLASSASEIGRLSYPLPLIRSLKIVMPDQYQSLDQEILRHLIRSGMNPTNNLRSIEWDAEALPGPTIWRVLGSEKMEGLEAILTERRQKTPSREQIREIANSGGAVSLSIPHDRRTTAVGHIPRLQNSTNTTSRSCSRRSESSTSSSSSSSSSSASASSSSSGNISAKVASRHFPPGVETLTLNCRIFYPCNLDMSRLRCLRHLKLTGYDSHLLPPHLPALLLSLHRPLESISLSSSKTSLLHDADLIERGCFRRLKSLDLYAVTPEWPLSEGIRSAGKSLKRLRLILDVSGNFRNFDNLFKALSSSEVSFGLDSSANGDFCDDTKANGEQHERDGCEPDEEGPDNTQGTFVPALNVSDQRSSGALPNLTSLTIDPFPQQNTAPSFTRFLQSCPKLKYLNGRRIDLLPPGLEMWDFTPERRSGALFY